MISHTDRITFVFPIASKNRPAAASLQTLTILDNGREIEDVVPLNPANLVDYAETFSLGLNAERDSLFAKVTELTAEVDRLTALVPAALGPRQITPEEFLTRFSPSDIVAIDRSTDPRVILAKVTLQTRSSVIDLDSQLLADMIDGLIDAGIPIDETERARIFA